MIHLLIKLPPIGPLLPKLIPIISQKEYRKQTKEHPPQRPPQRHMLNNRRVVHLHHIRLRTHHKRQAECIHNVVDADVGVLELGVEDLQEGVLVGGEGCEEVGVHFVEVVLEDDVYAVVQEGDQEECEELVGLWWGG